MDAELLPVALALAHLGARTRRSRGSRAARSTSRPTSPASAQQHVARARVLGARVVRRQQRVLERRCCLAGSSPAQWSRRCASKVFQTRGRSPNAKPTAAPRSRRTARVLRELLGRGAVLAREVLGRVLALGRHRRVELERLEVQLDRRPRRRAARGRARATRGRPRTTGRRRRRRNRSSWLADGASQSSDARPRAVRRRRTLRRSFRARVDTAPAPP